MIFEKMKIDDYDGIYRFWSSSSGITLRSVDDSKEGFSRFLKRNPDNNYICKSRGKIIGGILCGHDGRKGFIYHTAVDDKYRGRGIGTKLVDKAVKSLKAEHITKIAVLVNSDNASGNDFWESLGFAYYDDLNYRILPLDELNL